MASCSTVHHLQRSWFSTDRLLLFASHPQISGDYRHHKTRRELRSDLKGSLSADREILWSDRAIEMDAASGPGNSRKLFQLIGVPRPLKTSIREKIHEVDGITLTKLSRRLHSWGEYHQYQFTW